MSLKESFINIFRPNTEKQEERLIQRDIAIQVERCAIVARLNGKITREQLIEIFDYTHPFTKIDLRRFASRLGKP